MNLDIMASVFRKDVEKNVPLSVHGKKLYDQRPAETITCEDKVKDLVLFLPETRRVGRQVKEEVKAL